MDNEILERLKHKGIKITNKTRWMFYNEQNDEWVVTGFCYPREPRCILYSGTSWFDAFQVLLNG